MERIQRMEGFRFFKPCCIFTPVNIHIHSTGEKGPSTATRPEGPATMVVNQAISVAPTAGAGRKERGIYPAGRCYLQAGPNFARRVWEIRLRLSGPQCDPAAHGIFKIARPVFSLSPGLVFSPTPVRKTRCGKRPGSRAAHVDFAAPARTINLVGCAHSAYKAGRRARA